MRHHKIMQGFSTPAAPIVGTVVPNPKLKLLDQVREVMSLQAVEGLRLRVEGLPHLERFAQAAQHAALLFGGVIDLLIAMLIQESLVPTDSVLGDYFKDAAGGDFHKTHIIHLG